jgi:hypothetical protein
MPGEGKKGEGRKKKKKKKGEEEEERSVVPGQTVQREQRAGPVAALDEPREGEGSVREGGVGELTLGAGELRSRGLGG